MKKYLIILAAVVLIAVIVGLLTNSGSSKGPWHSSNVKNDGTGNGPYPCYGKHNTCSGKTYNYRDLYCDSCDPDGDNVEG